MTFRQHLQLWLTSFRDRDRRPLKKRPTPLSLEILEDRTVPSTITWDNRGGGPFGDRAHFQAWYGSNADTARRIVDQAIADWRSLIQDFRTGSNTFHVSISADYFLSFFPTAQTSIGWVAPWDGDRATSASITLSQGSATPDDPNGWFFDPTPNDDAEFPNPINRFA